MHALAVAPVLIARGLNEVRALEAEAAAQNAQAQVVLLLRLRHERREPRRVGPRAAGGLRRRLLQQQPDDLVRRERAVGVLRQVLLLRGGARLLELQAAARPLRHALRDERELGKRERVRAVLGGAVAGAHAALLRGAAGADEGVARRLDHPQHVRGLALEDQTPHGVDALPGLRGGRRREHPRDEAGDRLDLPLAERLDELLHHVGEEARDVRAVVAKSVPLRNVVGGLGGRVAVPRHLVRGGDGEEHGHDGVRPREVGREARRGARDGALGDARRTVRIPESTGEERRAKDGAEQQRRVEVVRAAETHRDVQDAREAAHEPDGFLLRRTIDDLRVGDLAEELRLQQGLGLERREEPLLGPARAVARGPERGAVAVGDKVRVLAVGRFERIERRGPELRGRGRRGDAVPERQLAHGEDRAAARLVDRGKERGAAVGVEEDELGGARLGRGVRGDVALRDERDGVTEDAELGVVGARDAGVVALAEGEEGGQGLGARQQHRLRLRLQLVPAGGGVVSVRARVVVATRGDGAAVAALLVRAGARRRGLDERRVVLQAPVQLLRHEGDAVGVLVGQVALRPVGRVHDELRRHVIARVAPRGVRPAVARGGGDAVEVERGGVALAAVHG
mmetsp:Transcript_35573/g.109686  ORF Transcript_35573/g.109686 Transcript_35573/m.109686 type:complete len:626 (-) Transcript_35573:782-2659(-)